MKTMILRYVRNALLWLGCFLQVGGLSAGTHWTWEQMWRDPGFQKSFNGSFAIRTEMEPSISSQEKELFDRVAALLPQREGEALTELMGALNPESSAAVDFTIGNLLFREGRTAEAEKHYLESVRKFPGFMRAHKNLGMVAVREGHCQQALESFSKALELGGEEGVLYGLLGHCHAQMGSPVSAESSFRKAMIYEPANLQWREGLAMALLEQERYDEVIPLFDELIRLQPGESRYWLAQADAFIARGDYLRAASNYDLLSRLGLNASAGYANLGDIYLNEGLADLAVDAYRKSIAPDAVQWEQQALKIATRLLDVGKAQACEAWMAFVRERMPASAKSSLPGGFLAVEARLAGNRGEMQKAQELLERAVSLNPLDGEALLQLGDMRWSSGDRVRAMLAYEQAGKVSGFEAESLVRRAIAHVDEKRFGEAVRLLRQAQAIRPRPQVADYLDRLESLRKQFGDSPRSGG